MEYEITGSIVTYKTNKKDLERVINSFFLCTLNKKLFISDNSPTDELKFFIQELKNPNIEYIFNNKNGGYGYGHNKIIKKIKNISKYHIILNPDIYFREEVLEKIYEKMEINKGIGNIMPLIKYPNGEIQFCCKRNPTPFQILIRTVKPLEKIFIKKSNYYEMRDMNYKKEMNVEILSGCFMFLRNEIFDRIGIFDERFFMYFEDFDLNRRIHEKYITLYFPEVEIIHKHAREAHKNKKMLYIAMKSAIKYFNKWGWL